MITERTATDRAIEERKDLEILKNGMIFHLDGSYGKIFHSFRDYQQIS